MSRFLALAVAAVLVLAIGGASFGANAEQNITPESLAGDPSQVLTAQDMAPPECAGMNLTNVVTGSGTFNGTPANDLITGSSGADDIDGKSGDDCIVAGAGDDILAGGAGPDVLLGGSGDDDLDGSSSQDVCYGGGQPGDTFTKCDTIFP